MWWNNNTIMHTSKCKCTDISPNLTSSVTHYSKFILRNSAVYENIWKPKEWSKQLNKLAKNTTCLHSHNKKTLLLSGFKY